MANDQEEHRPIERVAAADSASRARILASVRDAALAVTSELSLDDLLQELVRAARDLVHAQYAALGVAREDLKGLERFIVEGVDREQIESIGRWPRGLGLLGALLRDPRPLRVADIQKDSRSVGFPPHHPPMKSFLGVPIVFRGRILGNFYLTNKMGASEFSQEDEDIVVLFAAHAAVAIENARLFTQTSRELQRKVLELQRAEKRSRFLAELTSILPGRPVAEEVPIERIAQRLTEVIGDACAVYRQEPHYPQRIRQRIVVHHDPARAAAAMELIDRSWDALVEEVIHKGRFVFIPDLGASDVEVPGIKPADMRQGRFTGAIALPLRTARSTYGLMVSLASQPSTFSEDDLTFARLVAERLAVSLENYQLLSDLASALSARDRFISVAAHELKTPVAVLKGFAQALLRKGRPNADLQKRALESISRQSDRLASLTNELLDVARLQANHVEERPELTDLVRLANEVAQRFEMQLAEEGRPPIKVGSRLPEIWGYWNAGRIDQVLTNLVSNAVKFSRDRGEIVVSIWRERGEVRVAVKDQGIGIPEAQQARIFEPFYRADNARAVAVEGTGLGLHLSKQIVERLGGHMWFGSQEGQGSTFYFSLPLDEPAEPRAAS